MNKHLEKILEKMFTMVGKPIPINYLDVVKKDGWYSEYSWTQEQEDEFKEWFVDFLYNSVQVRRELLNRNTRSKRMLRKAADEFCFKFGWKGL